MVHPDLGTQIFRSFVRDTKISQLAAPTTHRRRISYPTRHFKTASSQEEGC